MNITKLHDLFVAAKLFKQYSEEYRAIAYPVTREGKRVSEDLIRAKEYLFRIIDDLKEE